MPGEDAAEISIALHDTQLFPVTLHRACPPMSSGFPFGFKPTFTQGLIIGQLSILILLGMILKYLFLESNQYPHETVAYHQQVDNDAFGRDKPFQTRQNIPDYDPNASESTEWFNTVLREVRISVHATYSLANTHGRSSTYIGQSFRTTGPGQRELRLPENASRRSRIPCGLLASSYVHKLYRILAAHLT